MKPWYQKAVFYHIYPLGLLGAPKTNHEASAACRFDELLQWIPPHTGSGLHRPLYRSSL